MRCLVQVADEVPEFRALWNEHNATWSKRIAKSISRRLPRGQDNDDISLSMAYALGAMVDGLINEVYVHRSSDLRKLLKSPREAAELLSVIWYRALYLEDPPEGKLTLTVPLRSMEQPTPLLKPKARGT